ncbi:MAG TPA: 2OG-Fe(II) oxygenase [Pseudomonadales bacterium]|nr:2OG-Fe(II) oxygenase [Pseudomonadales bacterium]
MNMGITPLLDYERLDAIAEQFSNAYQQAQPFPHIVLDEFLKPSLVQEILTKFPQLKEKPGQTSDVAKTDNGKFPQPNKRWLSNQAGVDHLIRQLYWELNSAPFLVFLEKLTGITNLIPDPHMAGGGTHETLRDGLLMIHADFNKHPNFQLDRRLNILVYLNPGWQEEWGGDLELWARDMSQCEKRISPIGGRCVIFSTTRDSFHGHPHPLNCPQEHSRKSIALYYYTNGRPEGEDATPHKTLWQDISELPDQ